MKLAAAALFLCLCPLAAKPAGAAKAQATPPTTAPAVIPVRQPKYQPKTQRTLHSDADIVRARENITKYPAARALADKIIKSADEWASWKDEDLVFLLTPPDVPRAFAVSASGCPVCGKKTREKGGDYAWEMDPKHPFQIRCPVDGTVFPSNDYAAYLRSGFRDKTGWDGKYVDDGWGWTDPKTGEKFWFVAYYNHWMWHKYLVPGLGNLADAYLLTGEKKYAHTAAVMLHRIAQVYPGMDLAKQSRYGQMMAARGADYPGKVVNHIWETSLAQTVADAYDAVFDAIDSDAELQKQTGKTGPQIRSFIEANFLEDAIDAYFAGKIRGNFGMHQSALVHLAQVRQTGETDKWFDGLMNRGDATADAGGTAMLGLNFALYDLIYRDGFPSETSPGYNFIWVAKISEYGDLLQRAGRAVFGIPRTRRLYDAVLDQINCGKFTPDLGDAGSVYGDLAGENPSVFQAAYRYYKDPRYAAFLAHMNATGGNSFKTFDSLFRPPIEAPPMDAKSPPAKPRLFDGYGLAILNNPTDDISMSVYYGLKAGHGHYDRLGFELFAGGVPIMPDLGYPDAMNDFVPGIYTWSKNTVSHNTVVVDAQRQVGNMPGEVKLFADSPSVRVMDVEAKETYPQCSSYRRAVIMVDLAPGKSYFVDVFTVAGGRQHDYSLHGPPGDFQMVGGKWSEPAAGTLAGQNVPLGQIYDEPKLGEKGYKGGFSGYAGSGFQHLFNVRTLEPPPATTRSTIFSIPPSPERSWVASWKHEKNPAAQLRIRLLDQPGQTVYLCDAHVSPGRYPQILKYLIARRKGDNLSSRFVSVIEPFTVEPFIRNVRQLPLETGEGVALEVTRVDGYTDVILYDPAGTMKQVPGRRDLRTNAHVALNTFSPANRAGRSFRAFTAVGHTESQSPAGQAATGKVVAVLPTRSAVQVAVDPFLLRHRDDLVGRVIHFSNDRHRTAHTVATAGVEGDNLLMLTLADDLLVGLAKIDAIDGKSIRTSTPLPLAPTYRGATATDELFQQKIPVARAAAGTIELAAPPAQSGWIKPGENLWLLDVGEGDSVEIPSITYTD